MKLEELKNIVKNSGIVGAGGAGFPTYMKLDERAEIIIMNCAECEPLLSLHRQLLRDRAYEILKTFAMLAEMVHAKESVIGIKKSYRETIGALESCIGDYPDMRLQLLPEAYPMGDEVVLIYEATGRAIRPGGLPIEEGVAVFNVETVYNIYQAVERQVPVHSKYVTVVGEVEHPVTVRMPIGSTIRETVAKAGSLTTEHPVYLLGGPMMGFIGGPEDPVTKTTNAVLVLPENHQIIQRKRRSSSIDMKRAASACCQCEACTDLCPRYLLGHPIEPHRFMRSAANMDFQDMRPFLDTMFCSSCGLCEMFSCPQGLSPRTLIGEYKTGLRKAGVKPPEVTGGTVSASREYRKIPEERMEARLDLYRYHRPAPISHEEVSVNRVKILLSQHIGAPAVPVVAQGDTVSAGQLIARPAEGLSVAIHSSIDGTVTEVAKTYLMIENEQRGCR